MTWPRGDEETKRWLARKLGMVLIPPLLWEELSNSGHVAEVIDSPSAESFAELEAAARRMVRVSRELLGSPTRGVRRSRIGSGALLDESEIRRARVFSMSLGGIAATDETVRRFRQQVLGGGPLPADEAQAALSSPALYLLNPRTLRSLSVPIRHHEA